ncbi:MAG: pseudouridine synthase [Ignavibacteriaceae bacterium]
MNQTKNKTILTRLNKFISDSGICSRRKAEEMILQGRVSVNNKTIDKLFFKVDPAKDKVFLDGEKIAPKRHLYFLLNKPMGVVTTTEDEKNRKTVVELIKTKEKIFPVGRLDYNTTGVLLLTNDGDFSNLLTHPKNKVPREYEVRLDRPLTEEDIDKLQTGVFIESRRGKFNKIFFTNKNSKKFVNVVAIEGRNHFVKKMFAALSYTVVSLNRLSYAGIKADIPQGAYRQLSKDEISGVINNYGH